MIDSNFRSDATVQQTNKQTESTTPEDWTGNVMGS